ncbi:MAG: hypothetical protein ACT4QD_22090 [Acidobacteriota bacterium]
MRFTIDIGPNLLQLVQLYFIVRYIMPAVVGATLLVVAVFVVRGGGPQWEPRSASC